MLKTSITAQVVGAAFNGFLFKIVWFNELKANLNTHVLYLQCKKVGGVPSEILLCQKWYSTVSSQILGFERLAPWHLPSSKETKPELKVELLEIYSLVLLDPSMCVWNKQ